MWPFKKKNANGIECPKCKSLNTHNLDENNPKDKELIREYLNRQWAENLPKKTNIEIRSKGKYFPYVKTCHDCGHTYFDEIEK